MIDGVPDFDCRLTLALFALAWAAAVVVSATRPLRLRRSRGAGARAAVESGAARCGSGDRIRRRRHLRRVSRVGRQEPSRRRCTGRRRTSRTPSAKANQACETCHGPGREHAESGDKTKIRRLNAMAPREASETCLRLPHARQPRGLEGQHARRAQPVVRDLPLGPQPEVGEGAAEDGVGHRDLRHVPQDRGRQAAALRPHAVARRQDGLRLVPQPARLDQRAAAARSATGSTRPASAATPRSAARFSGITRRCARRATPATIRTARTTIGCWWRSCRCSVSAVTSAPVIRRRSTTARS